MNATLLQPVAESRTTIALRKRDWKVMITRLENLEDLAAIGERLAYEEEVGKEVGGGII